MSYVHLRDIETLESYLKHGLVDFSAFILPNSYTLKVVEIHKDSVQLKLQYILRGGSDKELERQIRRMTVRKVIDYVKQEGSGTAAKPGHKQG